MPLIINNRSQTVPNIRYDSLFDYGSNMLVGQTESSGIVAMSFVAHSPSALEVADEIDAANAGNIFSAFTTINDIAISRNRQYGAIVGDSGYIQKFGFDSNQIASVSDANYISDEITAVAISPDNQAIISGFGSGETVKAYRFDLSNIYATMVPYVNPSGLPDNVSRIVFLPGDRDVLIVGNPTTGDDYQLWSFKDGFTAQRSFSESIVGTAGSSISVGRRQSDNCWPVFIGHSDGFVAYKWNGSKFVDTYGSVSSLGQVYGVCQDSDGYIYAAVSGGSGAGIKSYNFNVDDGVGSLVDTAVVLSGTVTVRDIAFNPELDYIFFVATITGESYVGRLKPQGDGTFDESGGAGYVETLLGDTDVTRLVLA